MNVRDLDQESLLAILDRIDDARLRYFYLMLGSAIANLCESKEYSAPLSQQCANPTDN